MPLQYIWLRPVGKGLKKVGPGPTGSKRKKHNRYVAAAQKKNVFDCMAGRNVPGAKQQIEELGEVISVLILNSPHTATNEFMAAQVGLMGVLLPALPPLPAFTTALGHVRLRSTLIQQSKQTA